MVDDDFIGLLEAIKDGGENIVEDFLSERLRVIMN